MNHLFRIESDLRAEALALYGASAPLRRAHATVCATCRADILLRELGNRCARRADLPGMLRADCRLEALRNQLYS